MILVIFKVRADKKGNGLRKPGRPRSVQGQVWASRVFVTVCMLAAVALVPLGATATQREVVRLEGAWRTFAVPPPASASTLGVEDVSNESPKWAMANLCDVGDGWFAEHRISRVPSACLWDLREECKQLGVECRVAGT